MLGSRAHQLDVRRVQPSDHLQAILRSDLGGLTPVVKALGAPCLFLVVHAQKRKAAGLPLELTHLVSLQVTPGPLPARLDLKNVRSFYRFLRQVKVVSIYTIKPNRVFAFAVAEAVGRHALAAEHLGKVLRLFKELS